MSDSAGPALAAVVLRGLTHSRRIASAVAAHCLMPVVSSNGHTEYSALRPTDLSYCHVWFRRPPQCAGTRLMTDMPQVTHCHLRLRNSPAVISHRNQPHQSAAASDWRSTTLNEKEKSLATKGHRGAPKDPDGAAAAFHRR